MQLYHLHIRFSCLDFSLQGREPLPSGIFRQESTPVRRAGAGSCPRRQGSGPVQGGAKRAETHRFRPRGTCAVAACWTLGEKLEDQPQKRAIYGYSIPAKRRLAPFRERTPRRAPGAVARFHGGRRRLLLPFGPQRKPARPALLCELPANR